MADKKLMIDSTILIDYFRKTDKNNSMLVRHFDKYDQLYISCVTEFEVLNGASSVHSQFWDQMLQRFSILPFDSVVAKEAVKIVHQLKVARKTIDKPDLFIAATAVVHGLMLDTANKKHFVHISSLSLLDQ